MGHRSFHISSCTDTSYGKGIFWIKQHGRRNRGIRSCDASRALEKPLLHGERLRKTQRLIDPTLNLTDKRKGTDNATRNELV